MNSNLQNIETFSESEESPAIIIDEEFKHLMPPLGKEERAQLEASILEHGCRDAIVLWEGILIDGHNRYEICTNHELPFNTVSLVFSSREEVLIWIIKNQMARRNLTPMQLVHFRGLHYRTEKKINTDRSGKRLISGGDSQNENDLQGKTTSSKLGNKYNVSQNTILRDAKASEGIDAIGEVSSRAKEKVLLHEVKLAKNLLAGLADAPKDEIEKLAKEIEDGTYKGKTEKDELSISDDAGSDKGVLFPGFPSFEETGETEVSISSVISYLSRACKTLLDTMKNSSAAQAKIVFRSFIDAMEELYARM